MEKIKPTKRSLPFLQQDPVEDGLAGHFVYFNHFLGCEFTGGNGLEGQQPVPILGIRHFVQGFFQFCQTLRGELFNFTHNASPLLREQRDVESKTTG
jgi:hypothetical protein